MEADRRGEQEGKVGEESLLLDRAKQIERLKKKAKRFFEIPEFRQYAIADAIYRILFSSQTEIFSQLIKQQKTGQLLFPFAVEFS